MALYPQAIQHPSKITHEPRAETRGIVIHWTAGHKGGDLATLDGPNVDCHFYVTKDGEVYQFLDTGSQAWHAFHTANHTCFGIEHEGSGEAWTPKQLEASAKLTAWLSKLYNIPVRRVDPHKNWQGIFGHADLRGIDGNDHTDTVPAATGWKQYLAKVKAYRAASGLPKSGKKGPAKAVTVRLILQRRGKPQRAWEGWDNAVGALQWIAEHGLKPTTKAVLTVGPKRWEGADQVTKAARELIKKHP